MRQIVDHQPSIQTRGDRRDWDDIKDRVSRIFQGGDIPWANHHLVLDETVQFIAIAFMLWANSTYASSTSMPASIQRRTMPPRAFATAPTRCSCFELISVEVLGVHLERWRRHRTWLDTLGIVLWKVTR